MFFLMVFRIYNYGVLMSKLEAIVKSNWYQGALQECFGYLGFSLVDNEIQQKQFEKDFIEYEMPMGDPDNKLFKKVLNNTHWFWKAEDGELYGLFFNPIVKEYTAIIELDSEWSILFSGTNLTDWLDGVFYGLENKNIPQNLSRFKGYFEEENNFKEYPYMDDDDMRSMHS
jgi:hypothetical protein